MRQYQRKQAPRILVTNAKGGSGKTTLATNLAAYYAPRKKVTLMDFDSQLSSATWQSFRDQSLPSINIIEGTRPLQPWQTRSWQLRTPEHTDMVIMDTPAAMPGLALEEVVAFADIIIIPVLPSMIDIKAAERFLSHLMQTRGYRQNPCPIGLIANRVRRNTKIYKTLKDFLGAQNLPVVSFLRDTQNFVKAFEQGMGITEFSNEASLDHRAMNLVGHWIDQQLIAQSEDSTIRATSNQLANSDASNTKRSVVDSSRLSIVSSSKSFK